MRFLIMGDAHFSNKRPNRRKDAYFDTQCNKLLQILSIYQEKDCRAILQPGDFFNSYDPGNYVLSALIRIIRGNVFVNTSYSFTKNLASSFLCVCGQHDLVGHSYSTFYRSPLAVLQEAGCVTVVKDRFSLGEEVDVYGCSFGEKVPEVEKQSNFNILIIHKMIGPELLFPGQKIELPINVIQEYDDFDLICCGDYHYYFMLSCGNRKIVNAGCLVRKSISDRDLFHEPSVILYDTKTREAKRIKLEVALAEEVFDLSIEEKKDTEAMSNFVEYLKTRVKTSTIWQQVLDNVYEERNTKDKVKDIISEGLVEVRNGTK